MRGEVREGGRSGQVGGRGDEREVRGVWDSGGLRSVSSPNLASSGK